jgi:uncharacterized membrane protein
MAERRQPLTRTRDELLRSFWLEASIAFLAGTALGLALPGVDGWLDLDVPLLNFGGGTASSVLETIATVSLTVAGISFSVIMVAFTLASQQHGPRVLPTFQADHLSHAVRPPLSTTSTAFATHNDGWCSTAEPVASLRPLAAHASDVSSGQPLAEFSVRGHWRLAPP